MLAGRTAVVTGGGTGIGAAIATALATAGAEVTITGRREAPLQTVAVTPKIRWQVMDVTDEADVEQTLGSLEPDILIANAGIAETAPLAKTTTAFWNRIMETNVTGVMFCLRATLPKMAARGWGRAIVISSVAGLKGFRYGSAYSASKHATLGLVRSAAAEVVQSGVTVNALCPGYVATPIVDRGAANISAKTGVSDAAAREQLGQMNPLGRLIEPDEVAAAALWLCGPGSDAVSGAAIPINGGQV